METKFAFKSKEGRNEIFKTYDLWLERWTLPNEKFYVSTCFGNTFIIASGEKSAPPLILLHGSAMNSIMWLKDAQEFSQNYRVYAVDIPGEPGRSDEKQPPLEGSPHADWLNDVFKALSIEKASLIGISLGGWLSTKFAAAYPEKVDKLVLLAPGGIGPQRKSFMLTSLFYMIQGERGMRKLYKKVNGNQSIPEVMLKYQMLIGKNFNFRREMIPIFSDSELKGLNMPTALFVGEKDIMFHSSKTAIRLGSLLPHASINIMREAGHAVVDLADKILAFLG